MSSFLPQRLSTHTPPTPPAKSLRGSQASGAVAYSCAGCSLHRGTWLRKKHVGTENSFSCRATHDVRWRGGGEGIACIHREEGVPFPNVHRGIKQASQSPGQQKTLRALLCMPFAGYCLAPPDCKLLRAESVTPLDRVSSPAEHCADSSLPSPGRSPPQLLGPQAVCGGPRLAAASLPASALFATWPSAPCVSVSVCCLLIRTPAVLDAGPPCPRVTSSQLVHRQQPSFQIRSPFEVLAVRMSRYVFGGTRCNP